MEKSIIGYDVVASVRRTVTRLTKEGYIEMLIANTELKKRIFIRDAVNGAPDTYF